MGPRAFPAEQLHIAALGDESARFHHSGAGRRGRLGTGDSQQRAVGFLPSLEYPYPLTYSLVLTSDWIGERLRLRVA